MSLLPQTIQLINVDGYVNVEVQSSVKIILKMTGHSKHKTLHSYYV